MRHVAAKSMRRRLNGYGLKMWDNPRQPGDIMDAYLSGDAPEGRFSYHYSTKPVQKQGKEHLVCIGAVTRHRWQTAWFVAARRQMGSSSLFIFFSSSQPLIAGRGLCIVSICGIIS